MYRVSHKLCNISDTPFLAHMLMIQAALLRAEQAMVQVLFFEKCRHFLVMVRSRYGLSLVYKLSPVCSKFKFSGSIKIFSMKATSHWKLHKEFISEVRQRGSG